MQRTADFHHQIMHTRFSQTARVLDNAAALDAAVDVLDTNPATRDPPIDRFLRPRELPTPGLLHGHDDLDLVERERQEAEILEQSAACGQGIGRRVCNPLVVGTAPVRVAQEQDREHGIDEQHVFHRVAFFLTAITARLLSRILGTRDAPFGPIVPKRGEAGNGVGPAVGSGAGASGGSDGRTRAAASASATPRRCANAATERAGASPKARSAARRTTNRTWSH
jgi:hypothetical protein